MFNVHMVKLGRVIFYPPVFSAIPKRHGSTAKFLTKLLDKKKKKKYKHSDNPIKSGLNMSEGKLFRTFRVSQVIYDRIIEYIDSGELDPEIPSLGVSISQVIWSPTTNSINVYWQIDSDDVEKKNKVRDLLNSKASKLRFLLIQSRISGHIPSIQFAWDKTQLKRGYLQHIDEMLAIADYGPFHNPEHSDIPTAELTSPILEASPNLMEKLKKMNTGTETELKPEDIVQSFRDDLYKLDHTALMTSIQESKDKLEAGRRRREKQILKEQKSLKPPKPDLKKPPEENKKRVNRSRPEGVPPRLSMIQKNMLGDNVSDYLNQLEEQSFYEEEWSDDEEDFSEEDRENIIRDKESSEGKSVPTANFIDENTSDLQSRDSNHDEEVVEELNFKGKPQGFRTLSKLGARRVSGSLHSPLRVRDMQRFISEESSEDRVNNIDLMEDEWSDEENCDDKEIPENKKPK